MLDDFSKGFEYCSRGIYPLAIIIFPLCRFHRTADYLV